MYILQVALTFLDDHGREMDKLTYKVDRLFGQIFVYAIRILTC